MSKISIYGQVLCSFGVGVDNFTVWGKRHYLDGEKSRAANQEVGKFDWSSLRKSPYPVGARGVANLKMSIPNEKIKNEPS